MEGFSFGSILTDADMWTSIYLVLVNVTSTYTCTHDTRHAYCCSQMSITLRSTVLNFTDIASSCLESCVQDATDATAVYMESLLIWRVSEPDN